MLPEEITDLTMRLIEFESHSGTPGRERRCAEFAAEWLDRHGVDVRLEEVQDGRPNVIARVGRPGGRRIMLNGHLDTISGLGMDFPAFSPFVRDGRLYGRGACDMKGPVAAMMAAMVDLERRDLPGEVMFTGVIGEEERSEGTEWLVRSEERADFCIVGEPSEMQVHLGHRGLEWLEIRFHGIAAHSGAQELGRNALTAAATYVELCERHLRPRLAQRRHPVLGPSAMNWGYIHGGEQPSVVAAECVVQLDRYWIPGESVGSVIGELEEMLEIALRLHPGVRGELVRMENSLLTMDHVPSYVELEHPGVVVLGRAIVRETGREPEHGRFPAWTDAALLSGHGGIPTVIFGPGSINKAHTADEFVPLEELHTAARIYARAAEEYLGAPQTDG